MRKGLYGGLFCFVGLASWLTRLFFFCFLCVQLGWIWYCVFYGCLLGHFHVWISLSPFSGHVGLCIWGGCCGRRRLFLLFFLVRGQSHNSLSSWYTHLFSQIHTIKNVKKSQQNNDTKEEKILGSHVFHCWIFFHVHVAILPWEISQWVFFLVHFLITAPAPSSREQKNITPGRRRFSQRQKR